MNKPQTTTNSALVQNVVKKLNDNSKPRVKPLSGTGKSIRNTTQRANATSSPEKAQNIVKKTGPCNSLTLSKTTPISSPSEKVSSLRSGKTFPVHCLTSNPKPDTKHSINNPNAKKTCPSSSPARAIPSSYSLLTGKPCAIATSSPKAPSVSPNALSNSVLQSQQAPLKSVEPSSSKRSNIRFRDRVALSKQTVEVFEEELQRLTSRFQKLSATILNLAASDSPVGTRSLQSLLTKEVKDCLGSDINSAKFAQLFIEKTRRLLACLNCEFEKGKVNPQLIKGHKGTKQGFLKADSSTTICYRDRYLKELVMNTLQGMCSTSVEEEVSSLTKARVTSEESRMRLNVLRDLMRAEAGLEPESFRKGEADLEVLTQALLRKRSELNVATRKIDGLICDMQTMRHVDLIIPKAARVNLRQGECSTAETNTKANSNGMCDVRDEVPPRRSSETSPLNHIDKLSKNCAEKVNNFQETLHELPSHQEQSNSNGVDKNENFFNDEINNQEDVNKDQDTTEADLKCCCSTKSLVSDSAMYDDSDEEITQEETQMFLKAFKDDINKNRIRTLHNLQESILLGTADIENEGNCGEEYDREDSKYYAHSVKSCLTEKSNFDKFVGEIIPQALVTVTSTANVTKLKLNYITASLKNEHGGVENQSISCRSVCEGDHNSLHNVISQWWAKDDSEAFKIMAEMKMALGEFGNKLFTSEDVANEISSSEGGYEIIRGNLEHLNCTVEKMAYIFTKISNKMKTLSTNFDGPCSNLSDSLSPGLQEQLLHILTSFEHVLNYSSSSMKSNGLGSSHNESLVAKIDKFSQTFLFLSDILKLAPTALKTQPFSVLNPPDSLLKTLVDLSSSKYFKDCFISAENCEMSKNRSSFASFDDILTTLSAHYFQNGIGESKGSHKIYSSPREDFEVVKPVNFGEQSSSREMTTQFDSLKGSNFNWNSRSFEMGVRKPEEINKNLAKYEKYLGVSCCNMTFQDVSDMFLFLSTVLNDVPDRVKSKKIFSLNPPDTLLAALRVLYNANDEEYLCNMNKKTSLASLTVKEASNLFLSLSKTFHDAPERVKSTKVLELDPPKSLFKTIILLTSLRFNTAVPSESEDEIELDKHSRHVNNVESQENFYDAFESIPPLKS